MKFAVVIQHAAHLPDRKECYENLRRELGDRYPVYVYDSKANVQTRSEAAWKIGVNSGADFVVFMDDDVIPALNFWDHAERAMAAAQDNITTFYPIAPGCKELHEKGVAFGATPDGILGRAYCLSRKTLTAFLEWRAEAIKPEVLPRFGEDTQIALYALVTNQLILSTLPGLVTCQKVKSTWDGGDQFMETLAPMNNYSHNWDTTGFAGWAFMQYHFLMRTNLKPEYVKKHKLTGWMYSLHRRLHTWYRAHHLTVKAQVLTQTFG